MTIDLTPHIDTLRHHHGNLHLAVISKEDFAKHKALLVSWGAVQVSELPDGRAVLGEVRKPLEILNVLYEFRISATTWIELRRFDDRYEEAAYVTDMDGRYVRVQTGMLNDLFGYVAVQSPSLLDMDQAFEDVQLPALRNFEASYERIAATPARL